MKRASGFGVAFVTVVLSALSVLSTPACSKAPVAAAPKAGSAMPATIVDPYLKISAALAKDSLDEVRASAGAIATSAAALGAPAAKIDTSAVALAAATEIDAARDQFGTLSEAVVAYMDGYHLTLPDSVRVASCPMKRKPWLQTAKAIENPYFGAAMLTCGDFR